MGGRRRAGGAAVRLSRAVPAAPDGDHPDLVVHVHVLVGDGAIRAGLARTWRVHGDRRVCDRAAMELPRADALAGHSGGDVGGDADRGGDRMAVLQIPHRGPLLRARDAGVERDRAAGDHGDARDHRGIAGLHATALSRRQLGLCVAIHQQDDVVSHRAGRVGVGLFIRYRVDRSMLRYALEAIEEDEDAAAAAGVYVTWEKLKITLLSAAMTAFAGALYCQYQMFISPDTVSGISVSLQMVFAAVVGGIYVLLGPTVGALITIVLAESLRIFFGTGALGWDNIIYGTLLVAFIIFLPQGLVGSLQAKLARPAEA